MYLMYVDESGDGGNYISGGNSPHFILSGVIIEHKDWTSVLNRLKDFRKYLKKTYGLSTRDELHASELIRISKNESYKRIRKSDRIKILRLFAENFWRMAPNVRIINICLNKVEVDVSGYKNYSELAWNRLIQRYDRFLRSKKELGIIISDDTDEPMVRQLLRKMRIFNPVGSHFGSGTYQATIENIIEDPFMRDSKHSYIVQAADIVAHLLYRKEHPKGSLKKFGLQFFFDKLEPLLLKEASAKDNLGIVRK